MIAVVHQPLGDVLDLDTGVGLEAADVDDELMRREAVQALVDDGVVGLEAPRHVVGVEHRELRRPLQPVAAHHADVGVRDQQDAGAAPGSGCDRADGLVTARLHERVARQERREVGADADRPHARTTTAVRDAESLVQIDMGDVGADLRDARYADQCVHVGAIHVHLPTLVVDDAADVADAHFKHAVR